MVKYVAAVRTDFVFSCLVSLFLTSIVQGHESKSSLVSCVETKKFYFPNIDCYIVQKEIDTNREKFDS